MWVFILVLALLDLHPSVFGRAIRGRGTTNQVTNINRDADAALYLGPVFWRGRRCSATSADFDKTVVVGWIDAAKTIQRPASVCNIANTAEAQEEKRQSLRPHSNRRSRD